MEDDGDDYVGRAKGYVHFLVDEDDLSFNETYYNIVKYEFNYLNYIIFSNIYIFNWIFYSFKNLNNFFLGLGQLRIQKFEYISLFVSKVETAFFSFLVQEDGDPFEWRFFPYEHLTLAFPESDFYYKDALFQYGETDLAYDISIKKFDNIPFLLHPLSTAYIQGSEEEYEENLGDIENFLKAYKNSEKILDTYKLRFINLYKRYFFRINSMEKEVNFVKFYDTNLEMASRFYDIDLETFYEGLTSKSSLNFRLEYDRLNQKYLETLFKVDEDSDNRLLMEDYLVGDGEDVLFNRTKNYLENQEFFNDSDIENYIKSNYLKDYSYYIKYNKDLILYNFSFRNFLVYFGYDPFFQSILRSKYLWSAFSSSEENALEVDSKEMYPTSYVFDKNMSSKIYKIFNNFNFSQGIYLNIKNFNFSLGSFYLSLKNKDSFLNTSFVPPFRSNIGFIFLNPFMRVNRDLPLLNKFSFSFHFYKIIYWLYSESAKRQIDYNFFMKLSVFDMSVNKTFFLTNNEYPLGISISTNKQDSDIYQNSFLNELEPLELEEEKDVDLSQTREELGESFKFYSYYLVVPSLMMFSYFYVLFINIF